MKKFSVLTAVLFLAFILLPAKTNAEGLECIDVDGAAIFGYDYDEYIFIGAISNEYSSESIANEYGAGNEYSSDSIANEYGTFGNPYGSYSAYNEYTSTPPVLINDDLQFIGFLTANSTLYPSIHPDIAKWCATKSYASVDSDLEDFTFKKLPSGASSTSTYSCPANSYVDPANSSKCLCSPGYAINSTKDACVKEVRSCPDNSTGTWGSCVCRQGYFWKNDSCVSYEQSCKNQYGKQSYGDANYCYCSKGYQFNSSKTECVKIPKKKTTTTTNATSSKTTKSKAMSSKKKVTSSISCPLDRRGTCKCPAGYTQQTTKCVKY